MRACTLRLTHVWNARVSSLDNKRLQMLVDSEFNRVMFSSLLHLFQLCSFSCMLSCNRKQVPVPLKATYGWKISLDDMLGSYVKYKL